MKRRAFVVYVDLDPVPGMMHTQESAQNVIRNVLSASMNHYHPLVSLAPEELQPHNTDIQKENQS